MLDQHERFIHNYRLTKLLGYGSAAEVYLGEHIRNRKQVAVKLLHAYLSYDEKALRNELKREAQVVKRLKHPNIIEIFEFGFDETTPFLIMSYAPNGNLRQKYPRGSRLSLLLILRYVKSIAAALDYAHSKKVIHCDLKPENVLLSTTDALLLTDFGTARIAQTAQSLTTQNPTGTPTYMAPEQFRGKPSFQSDQYALSVMVYEWLCGVPPFEGRTLPELMDKHMIEAPPSLQDHESVLSSDKVIQAVEQVILQALEKDPEKRFQNVQTFANILEQAVQKPQLILGKRIPAAQFPLTSIRQSTTSTPVISSSHTSATHSMTTSSFSRRRFIKQAGCITTVIGMMSLCGLALDKSITQIPSALLYTHTTNDNVSDVAWSPKNDLIACVYTSSGRGGGSSSVDVWIASSGDNLITYNSSYLNYIRTLAWSPDGTHLAFAGDDSSPFFNNSVEIWNALTRKNEYTYQRHSGSVAAVAWSPDGSRIASGGDDSTVRIWNVLSDKDLYVYREHTGGVTDVAWSPNGTHIASTGGDGAVRVWNPLSGEDIYTYREHAGKVTAMAWSPNGSLIASLSSDGTMHFWDPSSGMNVYTYQGSSTNVFAWAPDNKLIAYGDSDGKVNIWDFSTRKQIYSYSGHSDFYMMHFLSDGSITSITWDTNSKRIASVAGPSNNVQVWQVL